MSALDELERTLARAVERGAAADPARVLAPVARAEVVGARRTARRWPRRPWHIVAVVLLAGGLTTGALAATGVLRVEPAQHDPDYRMLAEQGVGMQKTPFRVLPLRVPDALGGPPWGIRTFETTRHAACAQVGQVYRGQFGQLERTRTGERVFRLLAVEPGSTAKCTNSVRDGLPILRGARQTLIAGGGAVSSASSSAERCEASRHASRTCPVRAVEVIRFGLLGPQARTASYRDGGGRLAGRQSLSARSGGAYLFVQRVDPARYRAVDEAQQRQNDAISAAYPSTADARRDDALLTTPEGRASPAGLAALERSTRQMRFIQRQIRSRSESMRRLYDALRPKEWIDATFADGTALRVAGHDAVVGGRLPGIAPLKETLPGSFRAPVSVTYAGRRRAVRVRFTAPAALQRAARYYVVRVRAPQRIVCGRAITTATQYVFKVDEVGQPVDASVRPSIYHHGFRPGWCPGTTYTARVVHHTGTNPGGTDRLVGTATFVAR